MAQAAPASREVHQLLVETVFPARGHGQRGERLVDLPWRHIRRLQPSTTEHLADSVPGDRAHGTIELLGRDSVTLNSGGEKIFVEEVETAILSHPAVADVVVCGRPGGRWG